jgi:hypothetical protein
MIKKTILALSIVAASALSLTSHEEVASASQADFQYGYVYAQAFCSVEYGYSSWVHVISPVFQYCPYGPQPNYTGAASYAAQQALVSACSGSLRNMSGTKLDGSYGSWNAAVNSQQNFCSGGCSTMGWSAGGYYSDYNNPVNCHP